jgi:hypothetical protein
MADDENMAKGTAIGSRFPEVPSQEFKVTVEELLGAHVQLLKQVELQGKTQAQLTEKIQELTGLLRTCQVSWRQRYDPMVRRFHQLTALWKNDTMHLSNITEKCSHPAYQEIIAMGPDVLPLIFDELERESDDWFAALRTLTGVDPVPSQSPLKEKTIAWLEWAKQHGYPRGPITEEGLSESQLEHLCRKEQTNVGV